MELTIRVISGGHEVDQITFPYRPDISTEMVRYRGQSWHVIDGCIDLDEEPITEGRSDEWGPLVQNLLPLALPKHADDCQETLENCFRGVLPQGVTQAAVSLVAQGLEHIARALLEDVLREHRDSHRLYRILQLQLLFRERCERNTPAIGSAHINAQPHSTEEDWAWIPSTDESEPPAVDDNSLRAAAANVQEGIGSYRAKESGEQIPGFEELLDEQYPVANLSGGALLTESLLIERTSRLGVIALDLLRYFSDNPGDNAVHAEAVLGYPRTDVLRLLHGSLGHYLKKTSNGGWECHPWVEHVLSALDEQLK